MIGCLVCGWAAIDLIKKMNSQPSPITDPIYARVFRSKIIISHIKEKYNTISEIYHINENIVHHWIMSDSKIFAISLVPDDFQLVDAFKKEIQQSNRTVKQILTEILELYDSIVRMCLNIMLMLNLKPMSEIEALCKTNVELRSTEMFYKDNSSSCPIPNLLTLSYLYGTDLFSHFETKTGEVISGTNVSHDKNIKICEVYNHKLGKVINGLSMNFKRESEEQKDCLDSTMCLEGVLESSMLKMVADAKKKISECTNFLNIIKAIDNVLEIGFQAKNQVQI